MEWRRLHRSVRLKIVVPDLQASSMARGGGPAAAGVGGSKVVEIIFWHTTRMPDELRPIQPRRDPEDIDLAAIKTYLEFLMEQVARLPTRKE